jgi:hypothetical protein
MAEEPTNEVVEDAEPGRAGGGRRITTGGAGTG